MPFAGVALSAAAFLGAVLLDAARAQAQSDTAAIFSTSASDLTMGSNYLPNITVGSATTYDVEFINGTYPGSPFTVNNGAMLNFGTLDDFDATQALSIVTNDGSTTSSITLNSTSNALSPVGGDLLYVAAGGNLSIGTGSAGTLTLNLAATGNIDNAGTLSLAGPISITAGKTITFTGNGATTVGGAIGATTGTVAISDGFGSVTLSGNNSGYQGNVQLSAGTLNIGSPTALGTGTGTADNSVIISGGTIAVAGNSDITMTTQNNISAGTSFAFAGSHSLFFNSSNASYGQLTENGATTLYLTATGGSTLSFSRWQLNGGTAAPTIYAMPGSSATLNFGNFQMSVGNTLAGNANMTATGGITSGSSTLSYTSAGTLTLSGTSTWSGTFALEGGAVILDNTGGSATMAANNMTLEGGNFEYKAASGGSNLTLGNITVGGSSFTFGSTLSVVGGTTGTTTLTLGNTLNPTLVGGTLNFNLSGTTIPTISSNPGLTSGLIGSGRGAVTMHHQRHHRLCHRHFQRHRPAHLRQSGHFRLLHQQRRELSPHWRPKRRRREYQSVGEFAPNHIQWRGHEHAGPWRRRKRVDAPQRRLAVHRKPALYDHRRKTDQQRYGPNRSQLRHRRVDHRRGDYSHQPDVRRSRCDDAYKHHEHLFRPDVRQRRCHGQR